MQNTTTNRRQCHENSITKQPKLMKEQQVSSEYNLSLSWLRNARWKGDGPPFVKLPSGGVFYRPEDVDGYIEQSLRLSTSDDGTAYNNTFSERRGQP